MRPGAAFDLARRAARKPPRYVLSRAVTEAQRELDTVRLAALRRGLPAVHWPALDTAATLAACGTIGAWRAGADAVAADRRLRERVDARGEDCRVGRFEVFGNAPIVLSRPIAFDRDPVSGDRWATDAQRRMTYRDPSRPSDVKRVWELARMRHLPAAAQVAVVSGDLAPLRYAVQDFLGFAKASPLGYGVHWACAMEVALRAANIVCALGIAHAGGIAVADDDLVVRSLYEHGWFLARNLEVSDVNGNHYLADAVGLLWLARCFAGSGESDAWRDRGEEMVRDAAARHVLADGLDHEGSLRYHALVTELFCMARVASDGRLADIDPVLRRMLSAFAAVVGHDGRIPNIGDDDGGRALALCDASSSDARRVLALAGAVVDVPVPPTADALAWPEDALWLVGSLPTIAASGPTLPVHLADGGIVVLGGAGDRVVLDVGPIGFRGRGGHGHVDGLSFEVTLAGRLVVRDSGTGTYTGDPALRERLRGGEAHSIITVDGLPYAHTGGEARLWSLDGDAPPRNVRVEVEGEQRAVATQTVPAAGGSAEIERSIAWRPGRVEVTDVVSAPTGARIVSRLQLPAGAVLSGCVVHVDGAVLTVDAPGATIALGSVERSERYDAHEAGGRLEVTALAGGDPLVLRLRIEAR